MKIAIATLITCLSICNVSNARASKMGILLIAIMARLFNAMSEFALAATKVIPGSTMVISPMVQTEVPTSTMEILPTDQMAPHISITAISLTARTAQHVSA